MRLENIPTQQKVVLLASGKPTLKFVKGGIVIHSDLRPCVVVEVDVLLTDKQRKEGFADIFLREIGTVQKFQPLWENLKTLGEDLTRYTEFTEGTLLNVECEYFIQAYQMTVVENVKERKADGYFAIKAQQRLFDRDDVRREDAFTEILTLSLNDLLAFPKNNKRLTSRTVNRKTKVNAWRSPPSGYTTGSHTNPNPKPNHKPNTLANPLCMPMATFT